MPRVSVVLCLLCLAAIGGPVASAIAVPPDSFDAAYEAQNYAKGNERAQNDYTPAFNLDLAQKGLANEAQAATILSTDGPDRTFGRFFQGQLCWQKMNGCAGDIRLYDWASKGYGNVVPILFTARNGSTLSGHIWWTNAGPAKRPGVVITNGSVQAPEELYWFGAQVLAKAGYVVMTWEPQGQGYSDTFGEGADRMDGVPSQSGEPFYDGTEDALDFFFSTPQQPYVPRPSCSSGTSHADKQAARVKDGRNIASNPASGLLDPQHVGIIGQSLGAGAVSYIGQIDQRVKTIVAWDNLSNYTSTASPPAPPFKCDGDPGTRPANPAPRVPAIGFAGDYPLGGGPKTMLPARDEKLAGYKFVRSAGLDSGEPVIRGGGHFEYGYIPNPGFLATERGIDLVSWYTAAWMDRYLKGDADADKRLRTDRWRNDGPEKTIDAGGDPNLFSTYYDSPLDTGDFHCADLRKACAGDGPDGLPAAYSFLAAVTQPDTGGGPRGTTAPAGSTAAAAAPDPVVNGASGDPTPVVATCRDATAPLSRLAKATVTRKRVTLSGSASDQGCNGPGQVVGVSVSIARADGKGCRFLQANGTFSAKRSCTRTSYLGAKGASAWSFAFKAKLPKGAYKLYSRAVDLSGNIERKANTRNFKRAKVK